MKKYKIYIFIFIISLCPNYLDGAEYYRLYTATKSWKNTVRESFFEGKIGLDLLEKLDDIYSMNPNSYTFIQEGDELLVHVSCGFDLYTTVGGNLVNQYKMNNKGYTCGTTFINRSGKLYLMGGSGFWRQHIDIMSFDSLFGSWEYIKTHNQPTDYYTRGIFQNSKGIFSLLGNYEDPRKDLRQSEPNGHFLDWESMTWYDVAIDIDQVNLENVLTHTSFNSLETKDYVYLVFTTIEKNLGWNIIDKESGDIYFFGQKNNDVFLSQTIEVIDNNIYYQSWNGTELSLNLEEIKHKSLAVGHLKIIKKKKGDDQEYKAYLIAIIVLVILGFVLTILFIMRQKPNHDLADNHTLDVQIIIDDLMAYSGQSIESELLDKTLGIRETENIDSIRIQRSRKILKINEWYKSKKGKLLIVRIKDQKDKRYVRYKIDD